MPECHAGDIGPGGARGDKGDVGGRVDDGEREGDPLGRGLGDSVMNVTHSPSSRSAKLAGKSEATLPSGPTPRPTWSDFGQPFTPEVHTTLDFTS